MRYRHPHDPQPLGTHLWQHQHGLPYNVHDVCGSWSRCHSPTYWRLCDTRGGVGSSPSVTFDLGTSSRARTRNQARDLNHCKPAPSSYATAFRRERKQHCHEREVLRRVVRTPQPDRKWVNKTHISSCGNSTRRSTGRSCRPSLRGRRLLGARTTVLVRVPCTL